MRSFALTFVLLLLISGTSWKETGGNPRSEKTELQNLPPSIDKGWKAEEPRIFARGTLFDYMNGGAELYLSYDLERLLVQEYSSGENSILVEICEMESSEDAFGLFSLNRQDETLSMGQGASYGFGVLALWKDRYFAKIIDLEGRDVNKDLILSLGKEIAEKIKNEGKKPELLKRIPKENLLDQSLRYFHQEIILNNLYFLSKEDILNLSEKTDAILANYRSDNESLRLLLIQYPDTVESRSAFESFNENHLKTAMSSLSNLQRVGENLFTGAELKDRYLIVVLEGSTRESVKELLTATRESLTRQKVDK